MLIKIQMRSGQEHEIEGNQITFRDGRMNIDDHTSISYGLMLRIHIPIDPEFRENLFIDKEKL